MNSVDRISRKFLCKSRNGEDFGTNDDTDFSTIFRANVLEDILLKETYQISTATFATSTFKLRVNYTGGLFTILNPIYNWSTEGFSVGDSVIVRRGSNTFTGTVSSIVGTLIRISTANLDPLGTILAIADEFLDDLELKVTSRPEGLILKFGITPNSPLISSFASIFDGQEQAYSGNDIPEGSFTRLNYLSTESSNLGYVDAKYVEASGTDDYIFEFDIVHNFRVPHYSNEWESDYIEGTIPDNFTGTNSYRYFSRLIFCKTVGDPNSNKSFTSPTQLGSVGFLDQNFNNGLSIFSLDSISYSTGIEPDVDEVTEVTAVVSRSTGVFTSADQTILYHSLRPNPSNYQLNGNLPSTNFMLDEVLNVVDAASVDGSIILDYTAEIDIVDNTKLNISFDISYSEYQKELLNNNDGVFFAVSLESAGLTAITSDREIVILDVTQLTKSSDISGLATKFNADFNIRSSINSASNFSAWINQLIELDFSFQLNKVQYLINNPLLTGLEFKLISWNVTGNTFFELDNYNFPLPDSISLDVDGAPYQNYNLDIKRLLDVPEYDQVRDVTLSATVPTEFEPTQMFTGKLGFKIPYRQWKDNVGVPDVFYNGALPTEFYNKNFRTSNYSSENGYDIFGIMIASIDYGGVNTDYAFHANLSNVYDFDEDGAGTGWTHDGGKIYDLSGDEALYLDRTSKKKIEFILSNPSVDTGNYKAELVIEPRNNLGRDYRIHTSLYWTEDESPIEPNDGETYATLNVDGVANTVTISATIDGEKLEADGFYNVYFHFYE